jgi:tRNA threonylcarbamoyl adenosine modification protein YeaZ
MRILSFDTSTADIHLALLEDKDIVLKEVVTGEVEGRNQTNSLLMPAIDRALNQLAWNRDSLDLIVCGAGPGGFTGVRVGVVTARTLAQALDLPLISVLNLDVAAYLYKEADSACLPAPQDTLIIKYAGKNTLSNSKDKTPSTRANFFVLALNKDLTSNMTIDIVQGRFGNGFCADESSLGALSFSRWVFIDAVSQEAALACGLAKEHLVLPKIENIACIQGQIVFNELSCKGQNLSTALYPWHKVEPAYFREPSISKAGINK